MALKLTNRNQVEKYLLQHGKRIETALIYQLEYLVAELTNHAKANAGYEDRTSNLKSSIGGVILKNGRPITYRGFVKESNSDTGDKTGLEFINSLIKDVGKGYAVIIVAGMEYASYVENYHNLNVLKKTELQMKEKLELIVKRLRIG